CLQSTIAIVDCARSAVRSTREQLRQGGCAERARRREAERERVRHGYVEASQSGERVEAAFHARAEFLAAPRLDRVAVEAASELERSLTDTQPHRLETEDAERT